MEKYFLLGGHFIDELVFEGKKEAHSDAFASTMDFLVSISLFYNIIS